MIRRCNGADPKLTRPPHASKSGKPSSACPKPTGEGSCDCGKVFDDVFRSLAFPHELVPLCR